MKIFVTCRCNKRLEFTGIQDKYECSRCGRIYRKMWIDAKRGDYTFEIIEKGENNGRT